MASAPEIADLSRQDLRAIMADDLTTTRTFEQLDPLKGNGVAVADYSSASEVCVFGAGPSLSNLGRLEAWLSLEDQANYPCTQ